MAHFKGPVILVVSLLLLYGSATAFTVIKNVNSGKPPVEKVVIFEKGKPADHLTIESSNKTAFSADGAIESRIIGNDALKIVLRWKPKGELKQTFDTKDYGYLLLTLRLEGNTKTTMPDGKVTEQRADNLWFPVAFYDAAGERVASANLADATDDNKTPARTTTLKIPMILLTYWGHDTHQIQGIGFWWDKTRANINRDFRLVVDKIALGE